MKALRCILIAVLACASLLTGCSDVQIPEYPGATDNQVHEMKYFGISFGKVRRVITDDSYDTVVAYYRDMLAMHNPEVASYALEDGRQTAITVTKNVSVAIQELKKEQKTGITYMMAGREDIGWFSYAVTWLLGLAF